MNEHPESMRLLLELALNSARKRKSVQTGYLHHYYQATDQEPHLSIPLIQNFLFALALLRSRIVENIQEAKTILEGLLHFQNKKDAQNAKGNFPIYLHEFPECKDRLTAVHIGCAIYWILKHFHQILGQDLKSKLEEALVLSARYSLQVDEETKIAYAARLKIAATAFATGQLVHDSELMDRGWQLLEHLKSQSDDSSWYCPASLGSITASLLMVYPRLSKSPWSFFWNHLQSTWHCATASYVGPSLKEWQQGDEPQVSLYDLFCGYFSGKFSDRMLKESCIHLEAVLIPPCEERFTTLSYPVKSQGTVQGAKWLMHHEERLAYSYFEKGGKQANSNVEKGYHSFKLIWGDLVRAHTFICQGGSPKETSMNQIDITFDLEGPVEVEDREKNREILFFIDAHDELEFLVSGQKASTFLLGEEVSLKDKNLLLTLSFTLEKGNGRFLGHRMLGNRPSQLALKGSSRFHAYDWQVFLRTIQRSDLCVLNVRLRINEES